MTIRRRPNRMLQNAIYGGGWMQPAISRRARSLRWRHSKTPKQVGHTGMRCWQLVALTSRHSLWYPPTGLLSTAMRSSTVSGRTLAYPSPSIVLSTLPRKTHSSNLQSPKVRCGQESRGA